MECFTHCGWRGSAVSEARTDLKDSLKVLRGKVVQDPSLKTLQVRQISSQPSSADPSEGYAATFEAEGFPFTQEFYRIIESRYRRFVSPFPHEPRIDPVRASIMIGIPFGDLSQLLQFKAHLGSHHLRRPSFYLAARALEVCAGGQALDGS